MKHFNDISLSNPRKEAIFDNWPSGYSGKVNCRFFVETSPTKGERVCRATMNKAGTAWCSPKKMTYANKAVICDGSDGRTYPVTLSSQYRMIQVWSSDVQHTVKTFFFDGDAEVYADLMQMFTQSEKEAQQPV